MNSPSSHDASEKQQSHRTIHSWLESQVRKTPDAIAITCEGRQLTYRELNERANQVAHHLRSLGVGPEVPVALCLERSPEIVVAILGILKAGGNYVPIDLAYPKERLAFMLDDSKAPVLLTQHDLLSSLPEHPVRVVCIDSEWDAISRRPKDNPEENIGGDNAAYVIYTSGSTGKPKGCLITHRNVVRLFTATDHWYRFNASDVWTLFHSYAFDFSVWEIWGALLYGGRLVIVPYLISRSPDAFYHLLAKEHVTVLNQTPSAFRQLIWAEANAATKQKLDLRYVIFGGEALELQSLKPWFDLHGDEKPLLVNMYGITETTVHVTYRPIRQADLSAGLGSVIGVPIPDLQIHLLDENLHPVPPCTAGELFIGGAGVARGYLNRPDLTSARFIPDPFSKQPGARLYRSGDLAQRLSNGELEYLGRIDHQVKIRGFRIELGEIESALNQHPAIRESLVIAHEVAATSEKRLVAYVVPKQVAPAIAELREYLEHKVPEYMVPAVFLFVEAMPLTPNGKIDRRALPSPDSVQRPTGTTFAPPRNETERILAEVWSQTLGIEKVGICDNFFELGGDSISSIAALSRAQQRGLKFSVPQLFENPTVAGLAACISSHAQSAALRSQPFSLISAEDRAKLPGDAEDAYPMIQLQVGMFYYNELNPASAVYHDVFSFRIHAAFDCAMLKQAVDHLVQRHPILRTSFHIAGFSEPMQVVHRHIDVPFTVEDVRHLPAEEQDSRTAEWIEIEKRRPFERTVAPLIRFHTQVQSEKSFQFFVSFHHVCFDGWSLAALLTEVFQEYASLRQGTPAEIQAPRLSYADFVALERQAISSEASRRFWTDKLRDVPISMLPRWPKSMCAGGHEQVRGPELTVEPTVLEGIKRVAQMAGVPLKTVLLAAHQHVMGVLYGQSDVTSGLVCNGRPEEIDGEKLIGLFLTTLPIRSQLNGGTWLDLVKQTFKCEQDIMPHRRLPLAEIQNLHGGQALFEAAFDFVHFHVYKNLQGYCDLQFMEGQYFEANNLTTLTTFMLDLTSTQLQMHIDYDPNLLPREQVAQISRYYLKTLSAMAANPNGSCAEFCTLSADEEQQLVAEWNDTVEAYPDKNCIHQLFEAQAAKTPDAVAVEFENARVSYRALDARANAIGARLQSMGIAPDLLVGVYLERSPDMVASLLGVLKAGGAYVPLDPAYPKERLAQMISDAQMPVIITQRKLAGSLPESAAAIVFVDDEISTSDRPSSHAAAVTSRNLAYTIYTSGSTGKPKGVQIEHRSVVNLLTSMAKTTNITADDKLLAVTTFSFDIAGLELFLPLITGGRVILASRETAADGLQLMKLVASSGATVMQATPATWRLLIEAGWQGSSELKIFCGGEALTRTLADQLLKRGKEVWNVYGPTETTIWSTAWKVTPEQPVVIGRPLANTQLYILDANLRPTPVGAIGELMIGGDGLARGYLNRPELTGEKFIVNPFNKGARIYRTGDLARWLPDGNVECLGRIDDQVKIRGYRIELGDISAALRKHPSIKEAVVVACDGGGGEKRLVAYATTHNGEPSVSELRDFLKTKLPEYMVPGAYVFLQAFPLTPSGKIDRKALPVPDQNRPDLRKKYVPPCTPIEMDMAAIWSEVLRIDRIGLDDNFFDLGGHSLAAIQIMVRIRDKLGVELPLTGLFEHPTIAGLAEMVLTLMLSSDGEALDEVTQLSDDEARQLLAAGQQGNAGGIK